MAFKNKLTETEIRFEEFLMFNESNGNILKYGRHFKDSSQGLNNESENILFKCKWLFNGMFLWDAAL